MKVALKTGVRGKLLVATERILKDETILRLPAQFSQERTAHSLQVGPNRHQCFTDDLDDYISHGCGSRANVYVPFPALEYRALRPIEAGEECFLDYTTCEDDMSTSFECSCGAPDCYGSVRGWNYLTAEQKRFIGDRKAPYLQ